MIFRIYDLVKFNNIVKVKIFSISQEWIDFRANVTQLHSGIVDHC